MLLTDRPSGRQLMVLDDAETITSQARRRAALHRRRREGFRRVGVFGLVAAVGAVLAGLPIVMVGGALLVLIATMAVTYRHARGRQQQVRRIRSRLNPGPGIGAPRPKGGFTTTRHRSGGPIWIDDRAA